jgi:hypothetical protein
MQIPMKPGRRGCYRLLGKRRTNIGLDLPHGGQAVVPIKLRGALVAYVRGDRRG